jgi:hypothetical protein
VEEVAVEVAATMEGVVTAEEVVAAEVAAVEEVGLAGVVSVGEVEVVPALRELDPITTLDCVLSVATMGIVHLDPALVRSMGLQSRPHHRPELMEPLLSVKMIPIWVFAVSHVIMAIVHPQPAEPFDCDSCKG